MQKKEYALSLNGKEMKAIFTDVADQANGSVIVKSGETAVLATAVMGKADKSEFDYFPLVVDYEEKFYAAGLVLGGRYLRREGRPSEEAILAGRIIDRTIRPLFNQSLRREVQIVITVLSIDPDNDPDVLGILAASLALGTSNIPWNGPVGAIRLGKTKKESELITNPTYRERENAYMELLVCGKKNIINMIEAEGLELSDEEVEEVLNESLLHNSKLIDFQEKIINEIGSEKIKPDLSTLSDESRGAFDKYLEKNPLHEVLFSNETSKKSIDEYSQALILAIKDKISDDEIKKIGTLLEDKIDETIHQEALKHNKRVDGRALNEVRSLYAETGGISEMIHGSGLFYRGGTHVLSVLTLGGPQDSLIIEGMEVRTEKYFMHHYNFPPFSSGEVGRVGGANRRAIGHGALAERALSAVIPSHKDFPYTIRLVAESMASNGSTSMASVCAGSLALMDGGVPIKRPVAGIAMGLMMDSEDNNKYKILTDIQGPEDHYGDMDFKVAGTSEGITAIQMDVKVDGVSVETLREALTEAKKARLHILDVIKKEIASPRSELKDSAPRVDQLKIDIEKIGLLIGPGGKTIKQISEETGAIINIDQDGTVSISGKKESVKDAHNKIYELTRVYKEGEKLEGTVSKIFDFGAVVELSPSTDGLVHISELAPERVEKVTDVVCPGERVPVIVKSIDDRGKLSLSIVKANPNFSKERVKKDCSHVLVEKSLGYNNNHGGRSKHSDSHKRQTRR